jgi:hypothetical protein
VTEGGGTCQEAAGAKLRDMVSALPSRAPPPSLAAALLALTLPETGGKTLD